MQENSIGISVNSVRFEDETYRIKGDKSYQVYDQDSKTHELTQLRAGNLMYKVGGEWKPWFEVGEKGMEFQEIGVLVAPAVVGDDGIPSQNTIRSTIAVSGTVDAELLKPKTLEGFIHLASSGFEFTSASDSFAGNLARAAEMVGNREMESGLAKVYQGDRDPHLTLEWFFKDLIMSNNDPSSHIGVYIGGDFYRLTSEEFILLDDEAFADSKGVDSIEDRLEEWADWQTDEDETKEKLDAVQATLRDAERRNFDLEVKVTNLEGQIKVHELNEAAAVAQMGTKNEALRRYDEKVKHLETSGSQLQKLWERTNADLANTVASEKVLNTQASLASEELKRLQTDNSLLRKELKESKVQLAFVASFIGFLASVVGFVFSGM